jgi:hypothetical protein
LQPDTISGMYEEAAKPAESRDTFLVAGETYCYG